MNLAHLTLAAAKAEARRLTKNLVRRVDRVVKAGAGNRATSEARELAARVKAQEPTTRNGWVKLAAQLRDVDRAPGTRTSTAPRVAATERSRARRDDLVARATNPAKARRLTDAEAREATRILRHRLTDRARAIRKATGENHSTRKLEEALRAPTDTPQQRKALLNRLAKIDSYKGSTITGARELMARGVELLGPSYAKMSVDEQTAVWDAVHRYQRDHAVGSQDAVDAFKTVLADKTGAAKVVFSGKGPTLRAYIAATDEEATAQMIEDSNQQRLKDRFLARRGTVVDFTVY